MLSWGGAGNYPVLKSVLETTKPDLNRLCCLGSSGSGVVASSWGRNSCSICAKLHILEWSGGLSLIVKPFQGVKCRPFKARLRLLYGLKSRL